MNKRNLIVMTTLTQRTVFLVLTLFTFFCSTIDNLTAQRNVLVYGGNCVNQFGGCSDEREQMIEFFTALGDNVTEQTDDSDAQWCANIPGQNVIVFPDLEGCALMLTPSTLAKVQAFINAGGVVLVYGQGGSNDEGLMNQILGTGLVAQSLFVPDGFVTSDAPLSCLNLSPFPGTLPWEDGTYGILTSSLPMDALSIYETSGGTPSTYVAEFQFGSGRLMFIAYDYFNGGPNCTPKPDWDLVSNAAASCFLMCDSKPSLVSCPDSVIVGNDVDECGAYVNYSVSAFDTCTADSALIYEYSLDMGVTWNMGKGSGQYFPVGDTMMMVRARSIGGQYSDTCSFIIRVIDTQNPDPVCLPFVVTLSDMCEGSVTAEDIGRYSTDACSDVTLLIGRDTMNWVDEIVFNMGDLDTSPVTILLQVCDAEMNCAICATSVTLVDTTAPEIICPADMTLDVVRGDCYVELPDIMALTTNDECGVYTVNQSPPPGTNVGSHHNDTVVVVLEIEDNQGNMDTCEVNVILNDTQAPMIACPSNVTLSTSNNGTGDCTAEHNWTHPLPIDNCHIDSFGITIMNADGRMDMMEVTNPGDTVSRSFGLGQSIIVYSAFDEAGNSVQCGFTVTVLDDEAPIVECPEDVRGLMCGDTVPIGSQNIDEFLAEGGTVSDNCFGTTSGVMRFADQANFLMAAPGVSFESFEGLPATNSLSANPIVTADFTCNFAGSAGIFNTPISGISATDGSNCIAYQTGGASTFTYTFNQPQNAFGVTILDWGDFGTGMLTFTNNAGDNYTVAVTPLPNGNTQFFGVVNYDFQFTSVTFTQTVSGEGYGFDEVYYGMIQQGGEFTVSYQDTTNGLSFCNFDDQRVVVRVYTITDPAGNSTTCEQRFIFDEDTIPPVIDGVPSDTLVLCQEQIPPVPTTVTATDSCMRNEPVDLQFFETITPVGCDDQFDIVRTWRAVDNCGNATDSSYTIMVRDTIAPMITGGNDVEYDCEDNNANNDSELISWLANHAYADASDNCSTVTWYNNYSDSNWVDGCGNTRFVDVLFIAEDECGNRDTIMHRFGTVDTLAPEFQNCPRLPIVENAETGHCDAYVNFSAPYALDNCSDTIFINQIDTTGLNSGDRFPVGTTILIFEAVDECGNADTCEYKIIVNDYWEKPQVTCRDSVDQINDLDECGAEVSSLAPIVTDSCPDHISITYVIVDEIGDTIQKGINDASGEFFPVGRNELIYCVQDQPILLLTEVTQHLSNTVGATDPIPGYFDGDLIEGDHIEITNFGPAEMDVTCLSLEIVDGGGSVCLYTLPAGIILAPGEIVILHVGAGIDDPANNYYNLNCLEADTDEARGYILSLYDHVIDVFATNGFNPVGFGTLAVVEADDFIGVTPDHECYGSYYRTCLPDLNRSTDWVLATSCDPATLGTVNPSLSDFIFPWNGGSVSLQSVDPGKTECTTIVNVRDVEVPNCVEYDTVVYNSASNLGLEILPGDCYESEINVSSNLLIGDINVLNLMGDASDIYDLDFVLISPEGKEVRLFNNVCSPGHMDFSLNLDDDALFGVEAAPCNPLGAGGTYRPQEELKSYYLDPMMGTWTLQISNNSCVDAVASVSNWELQIMGILPYSQMDTILPNDPGVCGAEFCWIHPILEDNCCEGTIDVEFIPITPGIRVPAGGRIVGGTSVCRDFEVGRTLVKYTLIDQYGNMNMCSFEVRVIDVEDPVIVNCPGDQILHLDCGLCDIVWSYNYEATDNCFVDTIIVDPPNGSIFPIGDTTICVIAIDSSGNADTCKYTVTVVEYQGSPGALACNDNINLSLNENCIAPLNADMFLEGCNNGCYDNFILEVRAGCGNTTGPLLSDTFTLADVGKCFNITVIDPNSGNSCNSCVCVEEKLLPELSCPADDTISCIEPLTPDYRGYAFVTTCDPDAVITYTDSLVDFGSCNDFRAILYRKWTVTDGQGHKARCTQTISVEGFDLNDIVFPRSYDNLDLDPLHCGEYRTDKNVRPHILDFPFCVDGYLLDSAHWLATGGDPTIIDPDARDLSGERLPRVLGWNQIETGPSAGYPSPFPVYYDAHPQWSLFGVCWGPEEEVMWHGTGVPTIEGYDVYSQSGYCAISIRYDDELYDICEDGYEILRYWKVRDMCLPPVWGINPRIHIQAIKVLDKKGPTITYPDRVTVGTDAWNCYSMWDVPEPWLEDECSSDLSYSIIVWDGRALQRADGSWYVEGLPLGENRVVIEARDGCGNTSRHTVTVTVVDDTPPVCIAEDRVQLSLSGNQSPGTNYAAICAEDLDKASYDNCTDWLWFKMIRMDELLGTVNGSFADNTAACSGINGDDDAIISGNQIYFDDCSKFCCEDADQIILTVLRVHDVDPGAGPVNPSRYTPPAGDLVGHFTDCWVEVDVRDKAQPIVVAPPDIVVSCMFWFDDSEDALSDPTNPTFGRVVTDLNDRQKVKTLDIVCEEWCEDHPKYDYEPSRNTPVIWSQACDFYGVYHNPAHPDNKYELVWGFDGYALRTCGATPTIRVDDRRECGQGVILRDVIVTYQDPKTGGTVTFRDRQEIWVIDCDPFYATEDCFDDDDCIEWPRFCQQPDALDGCGADLSPSNPQLGEPRIVNGCDDNCALVAIDYIDELYTIEDSACFKVIRTWVVIDWCTYDPLAPQVRDGDNPNEVTPGRWEFVQSIVVRDKIDPVVTVDIGDCEPAAKDSLGVCHGHLDICAVGTDDCSPDDWLVYDYKVDLYSDGQGKFGDFDVYVGKLTLDQFNSGQVLGQGPTDCEAYNQDGYCNPYADDPTQPFCASGTYPVGTHSFYFFVEDGCGNVVKHTEIIEITDCKEPTPYCKTGIITVVMPVNGEICVWASDLDDGSFDNCTSQEDLKFYFNGDTSMTSYCINCDTFVARGANREFRVNVEVWVEDEEGNADFCVTTIEFQDNQNVCPDSGSVADLTGRIFTRTGDGVESAEVDLMKNGSFMLMEPTDRSGEYAFVSLDMYNDYMVRPSLDVDWLNGVSTKDLVIIQRHLLGKEEFEDSYQYIAADVNLTQSVTTGDITALRKVILGLYADFSEWDNTSWKFVDAAQVFADPKSPWPFDETKTYNDVDRNMFDTDFVGVKIGDLSGDVRANGLMGNSPRTELSQRVVIEGTEAGGYVTYTVSMQEAVGMSGYQMSLSYDTERMEYVGVEEVGLGVNNQNVGVSRSEAGMLHVSWHSRTEAEQVDEGEAILKLQFRMLKEGEGRGLELETTRGLQAEMYDAQLTTYRLERGSEEGSEVFALYQNEPNPFAGKTTIGFDLPEAMPAVLTIYDSYGQVALVKKIEGDKGYNETVIEAEFMNVSGVYFYQLDAENYTSTKRMVLKRK